MKITKRILTILSALLSIVILLPQAALAALPPEDTVSPMYQHLDEPICDIDFSSNGTAYAEGRVKGDATVTRITANIMVYKVTSSGNRIVASFNANGTNRIDMYEPFEYESGCTYRIYFSGTVTYSGGTERFLETTEEKAP